MSTGELVAVDLSDEERTLLRCGLSEWGGPAHPSEPLATAMGFLGTNDFYAQRQRIRAVLADGDSLSMEDWRRALVATEIVFASDVVGSGLDWPTTTGLSDENTIRTLRGLQRKILSTRH